MLNWLIFTFKKKIKFSQIIDFLFNFLNKSEFKIYKKLKPNNIKQIVNLNNYVRFKLKKNDYINEYEIFF